MARLNAEGAEARRGRALTGDANRADFSEALARGLGVLNAFGHHHQRLTQAELAREMNLPRATVRRALLTLEHLGYVQVDGRAYTLTPRVLQLAESYLSSNPISAILQPLCDQLCGELAISCSVAVLDGEDAVMIARAVPRQALAAGSGVGFRVPAARSSLGRVLLAHSGPAPASDSDALADRRIRDEGFCYVVDDVEAGFHSVAVPVQRWDGQVVAAMNAGSALAQTDPAMLKGPVLDALRERTAELRSQLF